MMKYELFRQAKSLDEFKALVLMNQYSRYHYDTALQEFMDDIRHDMIGEEVSFMQAVSYLFATPSIYFDKDCLINRLYRAMEEYYAECLADSPEYANCDDEIESIAA